MKFEALHLTESIVTKDIQKYDVLLLLLAYLGKTFQLNHSV